MNVSVRRGGYFAVFVPEPLGEVRDFITAEEAPAQEEGGEDDEQRVHDHAVFFGDVGIDDGVALEKDGEEDQDRGSEHGTGDGALAAEDDEQDNGDGIHEAEIAGAEGRAIVGEDGPGEAGEGGANNEGSDLIPGGGDADGFGGDGVFSDGQ